MHIIYINKYKYYNFEYFILLIFQLIILLFILISFT
jgi:hypothetical protein